MTIDTEIRHITKPGANLFLALSFDATDAAHLHAESQVITPLTPLRVI